MKANQALKGLRQDNSANTSIVEVAVGIGIALTVFTAVIVPQVVAAKADTNLSTGEKAMIGIILVVVVAGIIRWVWGAMDNRRRGIRHG